MKPHKRVRIRKRKQHRRPQGRLFPIIEQQERKETVNELEQILYRQVQEDHDYVVTLRRWFHQHPELAREET